MSAAEDRVAAVERVTGETSVSVRVALDGVGQADIATGVGFFDHMLTLLAHHSLIDLAIQASGDTHVDDHHVTEDVGITLGQALVQALGDRKGIRRYGHALTPMDEALALAAIDISGRGMLVFDVPFSAAKIGTFDTELVQEFFQAVAANARLTLHLKLLAGTNNHHIAETVFKAFAHALREALAHDPRRAGIVPSTKGTL